MNIPDFIEAGSTVVLSAALFVSLRQTRLIAKQSNEIAKQTTALASSMRRDTHKGMVQQVSQYTDTAMARDPDLLKWFLESRGFPLGTPTENNKHFFLWVRLGIHQSHYFEHIEGLVNEEIWDYWCATIKLDIASPGFNLVWPIVQHTYAPGFIAFINEYVESLKGSLESAPDAMHQEVAGQLNDGASQTLSQATELTFGLEVSSAGARADASDGPVFLMDGDFPRRTTESTNQVAEERGR
jgi:hypothetical protein